MTEKEFKISLNKPMAFEDILDICNRLKDVYKITFIENGNILFEEKHNEEY